LVAVVLNVNCFSVGTKGVGLQLSDEGGKLIVRGFRDMPDGAPNPGQDAGVKPGDVIDQVLRVVVEG
jgi:hypothetical protein